MDLCKLVAWLLSGVYREKTDFRILAQRSKIYHQSRVLFCGAPYSIQNRQEVGYHVEE